MLRLSVRKRMVGTDAGSNALFGSLQVITSNRLGLSPVLMAAANSAGGVMGEMLAAQSIIVACAAVGKKARRATCSAVSVSAHEPRNFGAGI
jgi:L-lactate permease